MCAWNLIKQESGEMEESPSSLNGSLADLSIDCMDKNLELSLIY